MLRALLKTVISQNLKAIILNEIKMKLKQRIGTSIGIGLLTILTGCVTCATNFDSIRKNQEESIVIWHDKNMNGLCDSYQIIDSEGQSEIINLRAELHPQKLLSILKSQGYNVHRYIRAPQ